MKKKVTILIAVAVIVALCGAVYAVGSQQNDTNDLSIEQDKIVISDNAFTQAVAARGVGAEVTGDLESAYLLVQETNPPAGDLSYLAGLVNKGYDVTWLCGIYHFWLTCEEDIEIMESIYLRAEQDADIDGRFWIENAYNAVTNSAHGVLDGTQVQAYLNKGLTIEQMDRANILSRRGVNTIQEILDKLLAGKTWAEIVNGIYGDNTVPAGAVDINAEQLAKLARQAAANNLSLSDLSGSMFSFVEQEEEMTAQQHEYGEPTVMQQVYGAGTQPRLSMVMTPINLMAGEEEYVKSEAVLNEAEANISRIYAQLLGQGMPQEELEQLKQGNPAETIYNAYQIAVEQSLSTSEVLEQYRKTGRWSKRIQRGVYLQ